MKHKLNPIFYLLVVFFLGACTVSKPKVSDTATLKQEAKEFSLSIVKAYFSEDCKMVISLMSDSVFTFDGDGVFETKGMEYKLCKGIKKAIRNKEKTYKDYLDSYQIEMLTPKELEEKFKMKLPDYYHRQPSDMIFYGGKIKEGKGDKFIWDDMFVMLVRKEKKGWKWKGVSG